ncbi:intracellular hyaluronan-binding protein 4 isoform X1 [Salmo salar]|uniref:Intracellular hyaluronan-binding protein 4 isoform X1 n=1 Tax=Salmo salar TaxID=8030 RepID=A0A1S3NQ52_SALSA|nr:intracellular hyaluronan-binding protein 4 isoform X1 [Salmo salar]
MALKLIGVSENAAMLPDDYGCVVANRFCQLVDDEADPFDFIKQAEVQKEKKKKANQMTVKPKKPGQKESQRDRRVPVLADREDNLPRNETGGKCSARGGVVQNESRGVVGAERGARRGVLGERRTNQEEHPPEYSIQKPAYYAYGQVQGGGYRNMDTTGSFNLRGKREYERHSGTGISLEEKRGGRVAWNRGCVQDPISMGDVGVNVKPDAGGIPPEAGQQPAEMAGENHLSEVEGDVVVQVDMEMSLDEWKALQERSRPKAEFNLRKLDCKVPSKARVIHKSKRIENLKAVSVEEQEEDCHFPSLRRSANDITSHLEFNFGSLLRPSRGGRGQGRGGRGGMTEKVGLLSFRQDAGNHYIRAGGFIHFFTF